MAINIKTPADYGYNLLALFGGDQKLIAAAKNLGVEITQASPGMFTVTKSGVKYGNIPVTGHAVSLAKSCTLGPSSKAMLKGQFEAAINKVPGLTEAAANILLAPSDVSKPQAGKPFNILAKKPVATFNTPASPVGNPLKPAQTPVQGLIALKDASALLQKVKGTNTGSTYTVVALLKGLALAVRQKGKMLSIRAEGSKLLDYNVTLTNLGFDVKVDYASVHLSVSNLELRSKTLGAMLGLIGMANAVGIADFNNLESFGE